MGKSGRCLRLTTLTPSWAIVTQSGNLNFLESSGHLGACNGTDLPLFYSYGGVQTKSKVCRCATLPGSASHSDPTDEGKSATWI